MNRVELELDKLLPGGRVEQILQCKDGVTVARVMGKEGSRVLKVFEKPEFCRELENYRILTSLGIPTLKVYGMTETGILMEDILQSRFRYGTKEDLGNLSTARLLAEWYRQLHQKGQAYLRDNPQQTFYDEYDWVTWPNLMMVQRKTATEKLPVWKTLERNFAAVKEVLDRIPRTLTYNDFYYTNLAVARDSSSALMFDYNFLGKGFWLSDVRNVLASMTPEAGEVFRAAYGGPAVSPLDEAADGVAMPLVTLVLACQREHFPAWAEESLSQLRDGLLQRLETLLGML